MKRNRNRLWILVLTYLTLHMTAAVSAMQMGGFDVNVGNYNWQWQEEQQWNQSSWENSWENNWQSGDAVSEDTQQNDQTQDNGYPYHDAGSGAQNNAQPWGNTQQGNMGQENVPRDDTEQNNGGWNNGWQQNDNSQWNAAYQAGSNDLSASDDTDHRNPAIESEKNQQTRTSGSETINETLTETPVPTKTPKPTRIPRSSQTPTPKPSKKKNKKKQNKNAVDKTNKSQKENVGSDSSEISEAKDSQATGEKYVRIKDEPVSFRCKADSDQMHMPQIQIISQGSVQVLSFRVNGTESPWHWEEDKIIPDTEKDTEINKIELLVISQGGKLIKMEPWIFSS